MQLLLTNLKHFLFTSTLLAGIAVAILIAIGGDILYGDNPLAYKIGDEGPHIFFAGDTLVADYIRGEREPGFYIEQQSFPADAPFDAKVHFTLDGTDFHVTVNPDIETPPVSYSDQQQIIAISDIESGFKTFRDFLLSHHVIDSKLNWSFGQGHLVLVGDFVDRGFSTTQVLWFIYKLEQSAQAAGGRVHFILGNHEIKNLQGNYQKAAFKYFHIASVLGKQQYDLFDNDALLGRWLASKNTAELINGNLFVHGGISPQLTTLDYSLADINRIVRTHYRQPYFPKPDAGNEDVLLSTRTGPSWYRGYFDDDLSQQQVEQGLAKFGAKAVIVGHDPVWQVKKMFQGKVFAIDVLHPRDYRSSFPPRRSQGLLIKEQRYYRLLDDGSAQLL